MNIFLKSLNWKRRIALLALVLGLIALFAGSPYGGSRVSLDTKELALMVQNERDHVSVEQLADWIVQGRSGYRLLDLRSEKEFNEYHVPSAESVPLTALNDYPVQHNEKIILYSEGGIHASQAWFLLAAKGYKHVYLLTGGLDEWREKILFPAIPENATAEQQAQFAKLKEVSRFFGGTPQTGAASGQTAVKKEMPKMPMPSGSAPPVPSGGKKKKEGC
jgi:rhodanese-related sulfurtransferase